MGLKDKTEYNEYMRKYMLERYTSRREAGIKSLGGRCVVCGSCEDLKFDHVYPSTKEFTVAKFPSISEERFQEEIKKCQLLCPKCHNEKTLKDLGRENAKLVHGTISSYRYCKCNLCRAAKAEYMKNYKRKSRKKLDSNVK